MIKLKRNEIYIKKDINSFIFKLNGYSKTLNNFNTKDILYFILVSYRPSKFNNNVSDFDCNLAINIIKDLIVIIEHKLKYKEELKIKMVNIKNFPSLENIYINAKIFNISTYELENDFPELLI